MTSASIGHNGGPDMDGRKHTVRTLWAKALFADPDTPATVMAIAWAIHWYSRADGTGAALSNEQLMLICGISEPTATRGKKWLRDNGYVQLKVGNGDQKTEFRMSIPERRAEATSDARVITETTQPVTTQTVMTPGNHGDDPRVITGLGYIQERDSRLNQYPSGGDESQRKAPVKSGGQGFWQRSFNPPSPGYSFEDGKLELFNGTRSKWLLEFGDDEKVLQFALNEASAQIQPNSSKPIDIQAEAVLSRMARQKLERRQNYQNAVAASKAAKPKPKASRW